jgi:hydrogenase maturation protein HypF
MERIAVTVRGTVQGVGFRPFVFRLAQRHSLAGWVRNSAGPVEIEVEGDGDHLRRFLAELTLEAPPLARIESLEEVAVAARGERDFRIEQSTAREGEFQPVVPDAATCAECLRELFDPSDRRYRYPFINCTNCGPRFTIITGLPYDRPATTMRAFEMCAACSAEYHDPANRRFHAQPVACWDCGPQLSLPLGDAVGALRAGLIVALKGLGGYQLACDARDEESVARLRQRKRRPAKPFAVMSSNPERYCLVGPEERALLGAAGAPIVLLSYCGGLAPSIAPGLLELGVMLPYTPLHHLLVEEFAGPLVMTSGNLSEEPIARDDDEARQRLGSIADVFLAHDRPIAARYDDSVVRWAAGATRVVRRARGLAPAPIEVPQGPPVVATGAHLKAAFTVARDGHAFVGPHVGDLEELLTIQSFEEGLLRYQGLFNTQPMRVACDLHPDYASTRIAEELAAGPGVSGRHGVDEPLRVQHHHAHIASVIAEHALKGKVAGVAMDGIGLGPDGTSWGGEVLVCDAHGYRRFAHLQPVAMPGGDLCAREGWRMAAAYGLESAPEGVDQRKYHLVRQLAASGHVPTTSSAGRLFDAVASALGVCQVSTYEGEAAARLEAVADPAVTERLELPLEDSVELFRRLAERRDQPSGRLAAIFHNSLVWAIVDACRRTGLRKVALSGGCFQNRRLLEGCFAGLQDAGLTVYSNEQVPCNDGGISLGQALVAISSSGQP